MKIQPKLEPMVLATVVFLILFGCTSQTKRGTADSSQPSKVTARGYSKEGCFLNLKLEARERNMRLNPDEVQVDSNPLMLFFPFFDREGYRCSGAVTEREKRIFTRDSLYPMD